MVCLSVSVLVACCALASAQQGCLYSTYPVVGGGTAGLAIAARLAETNSVAVIEAGGLYELDNSNQSIVPYYALTMADLISVSSTSVGNRLIHCAQARTLGGTSALNTFEYTRGSIGSYQYWADLVRDQSYTWQNLLPYFKKSATFTPPNAKHTPANATALYDPSAFDNSLNGPVQVSYGNWMDITATWLAGALQSIGLPLTPLGLNCGILSGFSAWCTDTIRPETATRSSSQSSYLHQAIKDPNTSIAVYPHTQATKILFDKDNNANGVAVSTAGLAYTISANKEVILSAGAFYSLQLLMLSGIGPRLTLASFSIPVISNLPGVGQNLLDQIFFDFLSGVDLPLFIPSPADEAALQQYLQEQEGPYSSAGGFIAFEKIPQDLRGNFSARTASLLAVLPQDWPEIEYIVLAYPGAHGLTVGAISAVLEFPFSKGNVTISSASISDPPVINLNWLADPADGKLAIAAFKRARQAWASPAISSVKVGPEIAPGPATVTDDKILAWIRLNVEPMWHAGNSCKMGKQSDPNAVVDSKARVFGVQGLRVVDYSSFPFSVPGHPSGSIYIFAEKLRRILRMAVEVRSPLAQVKAAAAQVQRLKRNRRGWD
ncbi:GMC oxidoreductase [Stipitochalara longipes BDJ]|nr:GMC oxidoreductase [Stipitochalara longipes BDJ]